MDKREGNLKNGLACMLLALTAAAASAQDVYPSRPITMIVPFPPGGGQGVFADIEAAN